MGGLGGPRDTERRMTAADMPTTVDLLVAMARLETMVSNMATNAGSADSQLSKDIARVELESKARAEETARTVRELAGVVSSMRLAWAKAGGVAAVVSALVSSVLTVVVARALGG